MSEVNLYTIDYNDQNPLAPKPGNNKLGKDDFMKLLITQLRYQNPLEPVDTTEYVSQLAQFGALEQMQNLNLQMAGLSAMSIVGKDVNALYEEKEISGIVKGVVFDLGKPKVIIENSETEEEIKVPLEQIYEIR